MKLITTLKKHVNRDVGLTIRSLRKLYRAGQENWHAYTYVSDSWTNVAYGLVGGLFAGFAGIWLANIGILQQVFESSSLSLASKIRFLFDVSTTLTRNGSALQLVAVSIGMLIIALTAMFWFAALKHQQDHPKHLKSYSGALFGHIFTVSLFVVAVSLITPALTREGVSLFVSSHYSGTIMLLIAVLLQFLVLKSFFTSFRAIAKNTTSY